jgi:hypothetical protein
MVDTIETTVVKDIAWIRGHILASILAIAVIAGSIIGGMYLFESLVEKHDARVAAAQQVKEGVATAAQQALLAQLQQMQAANEARDAQQIQLIDTLVTQMAQQRAQTQKQVATDATLDAKSAGARLVAQTKTSPADVTVVNDTVTMDLPLTRIVVADLDLLPQAQSDVANLQAQVDAQKILTSDAKAELNTANQVITADKVELVATIKADNAACDERVSKQANKDLKRGFWASLVSFVAGIAVRGAL